MPKDISVLIPGAFREHIESVRDKWPVPQVKVVSAALYQFSQSGPDRQGEALRAVAEKAKQTRPRRRSQRTSAV